MEPVVTSRLVLEPLRINHATEMALALDDAELHTYIGGEPASAQQLQARYRQQVVGRSADGRQRWCNWVLRSRADDEVAGYVQATVESDLVDASAGGSSLVAELAWVVGTRYQGRGLACEAVAGMVTWLQGQGVERFVAHVHPEHAASAAVARSAGLRATDVVADGEVRWQR